MRAHAGKGPCCWQVLAFGMKLRERRLEWQCSLLCASAPQGTFGGGEGPELRAPSAGSPEAPPAWPKGEGHSQGVPKGVPGGGARCEERGTALRVAVSGGLYSRRTEKGLEKVPSPPHPQPGGLQRGPWRELLL